MAFFPLNIKAMKLLKITLFLYLLGSPSFSFAQKAYETLNYRGLVDGKIVNFSLADGYVAASRISFGSKNPKLFYLKNTSAENNRQLKFVPHSKLTKSYFILITKDGFDKVSQQIFGNYYDGKKNYKFVLKRTN